MEVKEVKRYIANVDTNLSRAMEIIDNNSGKVLLVADKNNVLLGTISDGDIRRWILRGEQLDVSIARIMNTAPKYVTEANKEKAYELMAEMQVNAIPVVDEYKHIVGVIFDRHPSYYNRDIDALSGVAVVIMAGGKGTRLYPFTKILPKPLIPIGEIPIVERVMDSFAEYGITNFYMSVNYKKSMIQSYFAETPKNYSIKFVEEDKPLGTCGSIKLITEKFDLPIIVANCDSLIKSDYGVLYKHHKEAGNAITMVTSLKNDVIPYGVVYSNKDGELERIEEKPTRSYLINTGMYVINPEIIGLIPNDIMFHMTELVEQAMKKGYKVGMYPISEDSFLDMGEFAEMKKMEEKLNIQ